MERKQKRRSGIAFFFAAVALIFTAITATVLLANEQRNLKRLLTALGLPPAFLETARPTAPPPVHPARETPKPQGVLLSPRIFGASQAPEQQFLRQIHLDPRGLCEKLQEAGFRELEWKSADSGRWECSSLVSFPRPGEVKASSIFILIKGSDEDEMTSFRVKLNIEQDGDTQVVTSAAASAASVFLKHVRWADSESITLKIQALREFDLQHFGSRVQFKRESGETPRFNFLANEPARARSENIAEVYFDPAKWLPSDNGSTVSFVRGPEQWNAPPAQ